MADYDDPVEALEMAWSQRYSAPGPTSETIQQLLPQLAGEDEPALMAKAHRYLGVSYALLSQFHESVTSLETALRIATENGIDRELTAAHANLGALYQKMGQFDVALRWQLEALPRTMVLGLDDVQSNLLANIAEIYLELQMPEQALDYGQRALELRDSMDDKRGRLFALCSLGNTYLALENLEEAETCFKLAESLARELDEPAPKAYALRGLGEVLRQKNHHAESLNLLQEAQPLYEQINDPQLLAENRVLIARNLLAMNDSRGAAKQAEQAAEMAGRIEDHATQASAYEVLAQAAALQSQYETAVTYQDRFQRLRATVRAAADRQTIDYLEHQLEAAEAAHDAPTHYLKPAEVLVQARRLQEVMLYRDPMLPQAFAMPAIVQKAKNVVNGDFYWSAEHNGVAFLAVGDATAAGVPAGMIAMVAARLLDTIVADYPSENPGKLLGRLHKGIRRSLGQDRPTGETTADGVDIGLLAYNPTSRELNFAGAFLSMYYLRRGQLTAVPADKFGVGGPQEEAFRLYTNHRLVLLGGERIFLLTDGWANQLGGPDGKRFTTKRVLSLLDRLAFSPPSDQGSLLDRTLTDWRGDEPITDDAMFVAFSVR